MTRKQMGRMAGIIIVYIVVIILGELYNTRFKNPGAYVAAILLLMFYLLFLILQWKKIHYKNKKIRILVMLLVIAGVGVHGYYRFSPMHGNYVSEFITKGEALTTIQSRSCQILKETEDSGLYRVDATSQTYKNYGVLNQMNTISGYFSVIDANVTETLKSYGTLGMQYSDKFQGLDARTGLLSLSGVKYVSAKASDENAIPNGFVKLKQKEGVVLYKNPYALPFGYTYGKYIRKKQYEALNGIGREQALLQYGLVEEKISSLSQGSVSERVNVETLIFSQKHIKRKQSQKKNVVKIPKHKGQTAYLYFHNLRFIHAKSGKKMEWLQGQGGTDGIVVKQDGVKRNIFIQGEDSPYYFGRHDYMIPVKEGKVTIEYLSKGDYNIEALRIVMTDTKRTKEFLKARQIDCMKKIQYKDNDFSGTISLKRTKLLCITVPYSKGWRATVDGKQAEILKTNGMFMGLVLKKGNHVVQLHYETPGLRIGVCLSMIGLMVLGAMIVLDKTKRTKRS